MANLLFYQFGRLACFAEISANAYFRVQPELKDVHVHMQIQLTKWNVAYGYNEKQNRMVTANSPGVL